MTDHAVRPSENVLVRRLTDGESVLLNMTDERYYGLNETGTRMWEALIGEGTVSGAHEVLVELFDVDPTELLNDLTEFVSELEGAGLLLGEEVGRT